MPSHMKTPHVNVSSRGALFYNTHKAEKAARFGHYALKRLQQDMRWHIAPPSHTFKNPASKPAISHLIQQVSTVHNLVIEPFLLKQEGTGFSVYTDTLEDPLQSDKAYTLAMEIVDTLVNKELSTLDQRLINYMQLPNTDKHDGDLIFSLPCVDNSFSREIQVLLGTIEDPKVDPHVKNHAQLTYRNIALNFFLRALSHRDTELAKSAKQLLIDIESHAQKLNDAWKKLSCATTTGNHPPLTPEERFDLHSTIIINKALLKAAGKESNEILDKLSQVTRLSRHSHPVLQHYADRVHTIGLKYC